MSFTGVAGDEESCAPGSSAGKVGADAELRARPDQAKGPRDRGRAAEGRAPRALSRSSRRRWCRSARSRVGQTRDEVEGAFDELEVGPREKRGVPGAREARGRSLRVRVGGEHRSHRAPREIFSLSAERRRAGNFERGAVVGEVAARHSATPQTIEKAIYADLKSAHRLVKCEVPDAEALLSPLRARPGAGRLAPRHEGDRERALSLGGRLPGAISEAEVPAAAAQDHAARRRRVSAGDRRAVQFVRQRGEVRARARAHVAGARSVRRRGTHRVDSGEGQRGAAPFRYRSGGVREAGAVRVRDEVAELLAALEGIASEEGLEVAVSGADLWILPGLGLCVPDLGAAFGARRRRVEVVRRSRRCTWSCSGSGAATACGSASELVERGLSERIVFAVSSRLRVSEEVLDDSESASLLRLQGPHQSARPLAAPCWASSAQSASVRSSLGHACPTSSWSSSAVAAPTS